MSRNGWGPPERRARPAEKCDPRIATPTAEQEAKAPRLRRAGRAAAHPGKEGENAKTKKTLP